jgi:hypothetical protein
LESCLLVEQGEIYSTVFIPDAPRHDAGEIKLYVPIVSKKLDISSNKFFKALRPLERGY